MPLQPTELLFVDDQTVTCPHCKRERSAQQEWCPHCGTEDILASLSKHSTNFHLSSLLLLTTLIAVCFALFRIAPGLGTAAFLMVAFSTVRTAILVRERKRHRYPTALRDVIKFFATSVAGILLMLAVFVGVSFGAGFFLGMIVTTLAWRSNEVGVVLFFVISVASVASALYVVWQSPQFRRTLWRSITASTLCGLMTVVAFWYAQPELSAFILLFFLCATACTAIVLACRRQGAGHVKSLIVGTCFGLWLVGNICLLPVHSRVAREMAPMMGIFGLGIWPALLSVMAIERFWSWDDAFPYVRSQQPNLTLLPTGTPVIDEPGIEFPDDQREPHSEQSSAPGKDT
jgi:hypothetical protein